MKQLTIPLPKLKMKFNDLDENENEESAFSFSNDLLSNIAYKFLRKKDKCLSIMISDNSIPNSKIQQS